MWLVKTSCKINLIYMEKFRNFITPLHKSAKRDYFDRMFNDKAKCIQIAKDLILIIGILVEEQIWRLQIYSRSLEANG